MNQIQALSARQLRRESQNLEYLLRSFISDSYFVGDGKSGSIIYFADAHEIKSFIDPDDDGNLAGFVLAAERALSEHAVGPELDHKLKNDLVLRQLLFGRERQVGLLPSHGEEVNEEISFKQLRAISAKIKMLDAAKEEWTKIRAKPETRQLLALAADKPRDSGERQRFVTFFRQAAPTLMSLLRPSPDSPQRRIEALVERSVLVRLSDLSWEAFGFDEINCERLRQVRPQSSRLQFWMHYLSTKKERKQNSIRSNRIDGEALAYLEALNQELASIPEPKVSARLVTRAMTLINAGRTADPPVDFLRHPRLLALSGLAASSPIADRLAANALVISLQTYQAQLKTGEGSLPGYDEVGLKQVVEKLLQAWHKFEHSRFAVDLGSELQARTSDVEENDSDLQELVNWFKYNHDIIAIVQNDLLRTIGNFGEATFALGREGRSSEVQAIILASNASPRIRIYPMVVGAPGPVDFYELSGKDQGRVCDIEELTSLLPSNSPERYLSWSLLFACESRWKLAGIYAESAVAIGFLLKSERTIAEAQLLHAQIGRLSGTAGEEHKVGDAIRRFSRTDKALCEGRFNKDARALRERAAQLLEITLHLGTRETSLPSLRKGIDFLQSALELNDGDDFVRSRILELGLTFFLTARIHPEHWPDITENDYSVMRNWHTELCQILNRQRQTLMVDEISRRARAMEIVGFELIRWRPADHVFGAPERVPTRSSQGHTLEIPAPLRIGVSELREQISKCKDLTAKLIYEELDHIVHILRANRPRDLIYAPVWASYHAEKIIDLIPNGQARELACNAYGLLKKVAGASLQTGIHPNDRSSLEQVAEQLVKARNILSDCDPKSDIMFYLRMDHCYSRLLLTRIAKVSAKSKLLEELEVDYRKIAADFPNASIPHFRLDVVLSDLERDDEAFTALTEALRLVEVDRFLHTPNHWVRSTMQRRLASRLSRAAEAQVNELEKGNSGVDRALVLKQLLEAFNVMFEGWKSPESSDADYLYQLEARRRINNIVYIASLILKLDANCAELRQLGFGASQLKAMMDRLQDGRIEDMTEQALIHTIGYASAVINDFQTAASAGRRLMELIIEMGEDPRDASVARVVADAILWQGASAV